MVDGSLRPGQRKIIEKGSSGVSVVVYRHIKLADGTVKNELVSRNRYPPQDTIVGIGSSVKFNKAGKVPAEHAVETANSLKVHTD